MRKYPHNLPFGLEYIDHNTIRKSYSFSNESTLLLMEAVCNHFIKKPDPLIVPIFNFQKLGYDKTRGLHQYYYDMKALLMISEEEKSLVHKVRWKKYISLADQNSYSSLIGFLAKVVEDGRYHDLHYGNVMVDEEDNYKLIDVESFISMSAKEKQWVPEELSL